MYRLDLYWKDIFMSNFDTLGDNPEFVYKEYSNELIRIGLEDGIPLGKQRLMLLNYCEKLYERKKQKRKISSEEHFQFLSCFFALHKLNFKPTFNDYIFLKKKKHAISKRKNPSRR